jgi:hypothetical protein
MIRYLAEKVSRKNAAVSGNLLWNYNDVWTETMRSGTKITNIPDGRRTEI